MMTPAEKINLLIVLCIWSCGMCIWSCGIGVLKMDASFSSGMKSSYDHHIDKQPPAHGMMRIASTFEQAREAAKAFQGKPLTNRQTGMEAVMSRKSLDKMLSSVAVNKSENPVVHAIAVANADVLFECARWGWSKPDRDADPNIFAIHRLFAPMELDGRMKMVKLTVREIARRDQPDQLYTVEVMDFNEKSPAATWADSTVRSDGIDPTSDLSARDVLTLAQRIERFNTCIL